MPPAKYTFKTAAVPRGRKAERAATRLILGEDPGVWHGSESHMRDILESRKLRPGSTNMYSPLLSGTPKGSYTPINDLPEVYSGYGGPVSGYMDRDAPGVVVPSRPVLDAPGRVLSEQERVKPFRAQPEHDPFYQSGVVPPRVIPAPYGRSRGAKEWLLTPNEIPIPSRATVIAKPMQKGGFGDLIKKNRLRYIPSDTFYRKYDELSHLPRRTPELLAAAPAPAPAPAPTPTPNPKFRPALAQVPSTNPLLQSLKNRANQVGNAFSQNVAAPVGNFFSRLKSRI